MKGLYGKKHFDIICREREAPEKLDDHYAVVRVHACGLCGTDMRFLRDCTEYHPMGHEISGEVVKTGADVCRVKAGQRVIVEDAAICGACDDCKAGNVHLCRQGHTLEGQPGMSDYLVVHEGMLNVFDSIDHVTASMTEPLAVAISSIKRARITDADKLLIFGMGSIGLLLLAYARSIGVRKAVMVDYMRGTKHARACEAAAERYGATDIYYSADADYIAGIISKHGYFDAAIVTAPPTMAPPALECVKYGGSVLAMGVTFDGGGSAALDINDMIFNKKSLLTAIAEPAMYYPLAIDLISDNTIDVAGIITNTVPMFQCDELVKLYDHDDAVIKTVLVNDG